MSSLTRNIFVGLVHGPMKDKAGQEVVTSVTNLDVHDIARLSRTMGLGRYFIVTPLVAQQGMVRSIIEHWQSDVASVYNPHRVNALSTVELTSTMQETQARVEALTGHKPLTVITAASYGISQKGVSGNTADLVKRWRELSPRPLLVYFGTGWGFLGSTLDEADYRLEPIYSLSDDGFNHLSVRSAVAITVDRICRELG
jgi:hypothetical protein